MKCLPIQYPDQLNFTLLINVSLSIMLFCWPIGSFSYGLFALFCRLEDVQEFALASFLTFFTYKIYRLIKRSAFMKIYYVLTLIKCICFFIITVALCIKITVYRFLKRVKNRTQILDLILQPNNTTFYQSLILDISGLAL